MRRRKRPNVPLRLAGAAVAAVAAAAGFGYISWGTRHERARQRIALPVATVWLGPVSEAQVRGADLPGVPTIYLPCKGDGTPSCAQIADGWLDSAKRKLPGLRRALHLPDGPLLLAAFSAGGQIVRRVLAHPDDRAEVAGIVLADATYSTEWADNRRAKPIVEYVTWGREALERARLFVATASPSPNKNYPSASQSLQAIRDQLTAKAFGQPSTPSGLPDAEWSWRVGGVTLLGYGTEFSHPAHATVLAPRVFQHVVRPWFGLD